MDVESAADLEEFEGQPALVADRADFATFFASTKRDMLRLAFLLTGSSSSSEEAVQEAYVRLYERWDDVDEPGAYLRRAVVNRCASWHRHRAVVHRTRGPRRHRRVLRRPARRAR